MPENQFPLDPPRFAAMPNPTRNRILLVSDPNTAIPSAVQVATVPADIDVHQLVDALNNAAWAGDDTELTHIEQQLPEPVRHSLRQAIEGLPPNDQIVIGESGVPLRVVTTMSFSPQ
ncbi:hypothetical protein, partial [Kitasatospora herbaricolor]|uniref:hypothetical protein n=1 Tax=Kitasatospora herbaricolor TaxID=68217 RepID=UPI0036DAB72E